MRLFAAICLSPAVCDSLEESISVLRSQGSGTFTRPENLHLTLAFIGETEQVEAAAFALRRAAVGGSFPMVVEGLGCFDDLWWAGIRENPELERLALDVQACLREAGLSIEERPWRPHITLVRRWRGPIPRVILSPVSMRVSKVSLMKSEHLDGQLTYTELCSAEL